jgi:NADH:ubiquinone oxidoreductase subunit 2 (subunit N)
VASVVLYRQPAGPTESRVMLSDMLVADRMGFALTGCSRTMMAALALIVPAHQRAHDWESGEYYGVLLLAVAGMAILAQAGNLVTIFIGIETMSIGVYVMTALRRRSRRGNEAAMKYFLMGAFATGFLLYGMALVYGAAGTTEPGAHAARAGRHPQHRRCWSPACSCSSSRSASRSPPCRSTCGRPTPTRARRPR